MNQEKMALWSLRITLLNCIVVLVFMLSQFYTLIAKPSEVGWLKYILALILLVVIIATIVVVRQMQKFRKNT